MNKNIQEYKILRELYRRKIKNDFKSFIKYTKNDYSLQWFHKQICEKIQCFENKEIKKLMIFMPPQYGKSEISTRRYPAWTLGNNPNQKIGVVSYNATIGAKFGKDIQRIMTDKNYRYLFPEINLNIEGNDGYLKNKAEFEIPNYKGSVVSIGVGGALTSRQIDKLIIDDIYKDSQNAWSSTIRQNVWEWYNTTAETRLHNDSQILIVFTRWHQDDLAGKLLKEEPNQWTVIKYPALKTDEFIENDIRKIGEALWEDRHSKEKLINIKSKNPMIFANLFQQEPMPQIGLLYTNLKTYNLDIKNEIGEVKIYCDVADTGKDYLCSIAYKVINNQAFILDVIYTQKSVEYTEIMLVEQCIKFDVVEAVIESNNGGRVFGRNVEKLLNEKNYYKTQIVPHHQSKNKMARILSNQSSVQRNVFFPKNWQINFPIFYDHVNKFTKAGTNQTDDCVDTLTGIVEELENTSKPFIY